ncbi:immunogenic protein P37 [Borreliella americana]|uniref:immunogenic protein P37 n=1 Tax=Borreliella americana TaxID=478807 RepID=UPI001E635F60|nr:immunogenic protein P37 [Borreliella americana]MCD2382655.1 immunogenic protein P37 [Borreliella americana]
MNLIIKVLLIFSLFCNVISCKLYEKLTNKSQQALTNNRPFVNDKDINDNKSINSTNKPDNASLDFVKNNNISDRKARIIGGREVNNQEQNNKNKSKEKENSIKKSEKSYNLGTQINNNLNSKHSNTSEVDNRKHNTDKKSQQVNKESNEAIAAREIMYEAATFLEEIEKITAALETIKSKLDKIKSVIEDARSYLRTARKSKSKTNNNTLLLHNLNQEINKVNSSHASAKSHCNDAIGALARSKNDFEDAKRKAERALEEAIKDIPSLGYNYLYHSWIADAQKAIKNAKSLFENAKNKQEELNAEMNKANVEFLELEKAYEVLQTKES